MTALCCPSLTIASSPRRLSVHLNSEPVMLTSSSRVLRYCDSARLARFPSTLHANFMCQRAEQAVRYSDARSSAMTSSEAVDDFATTSLGAEGAATMLERLRQSDGLCTDG
jgi:hypothetical protein